MVKFAFKYPQVVILIAMITLISSNISQSQSGHECNLSSQASDGVTTNSDWLPCEQTLNGTTMVYVPSGEFRMGSTIEEVNDAHHLLADILPFEVEDPHKLTFFNIELTEDHVITSIPTPYWIDKYEVSNTQYRQCILMGVCIPARFYPPDDTYPITNITRVQAAQYCEWRGGQLPSEVEWEYAARGPDRLIYPWGTTIDANLANFSVSDESISTQLAPIDSYINGVSWVGAHHISGNVSEWTRSVLTAYPYDANQAEISLDSTHNIIFRGGSFVEDKVYLRTAWRGISHGGTGLETIGFRCVYPDNIEDLSLNLDTLPTAPDKTINTFTISEESSEDSQMRTVYWDVSGIDHVTLEIRAFASYQRPQIQTVMTYNDLPNSGQQEITLPNVPSTIYLIVDPFIVASQSPNSSRLLQSHVKNK